MKPWRGYYSDIFCIAQVPLGPLIRDNPGNFVAFLQQAYVFSVDIQFAALTKTLKNIILIKQIPKGIVTLQQSLGVRSKKCVFEQQAAVSPKDIQPQVENTQ